MKRFGYILVSLLLVIGISWVVSSFLRHATKKAPVSKTAKSASVPQLLAKSVPIPRQSDSCNQQWAALANLDLESYGSGKRVDPGLISMERVWDLLADVEIVQKKSPCLKQTISENELVLRSDQVQYWCGLARKLGPDHAMEFSARLNFPPELLKDLRLQSAPIDKCLASLEIMRQDLADKATEGTSLADISNLPLLMNKFFARGRKNPADLNTLRLISDRMLQIDPTNVGAAYMAVQVAFAEWSKNPSGDSESLERAYDRVQQLASDDPYFTIYRMEYDLQHGDFEKLEETAQNLVLTEGGRNIGYYYLAEIDYQLGDVDAAKNDLAQVAAGEFGDYKPQAFIVLKRLQTEGDVPNPKVPLFPSPGVSINTAILFPAKLPGMPSATTLAGGSVGFTLVEDGMNRIIATSPYREYFEESLAINSRQIADDPDLH